MAKVNPDSTRSKIADLALQIAEHQARIQTISANWGAEIIEQLNASEKLFLSRLSKELKGFKFNANAKETLARLKKITDRLNSIRQTAFRRAEEKIKSEARKLAENETKWGKRITKELSEPGTKLKDAAPALLDKVVKFGLADGKTLQEYFSGVADADAIRIESTIRQGVESGWTIDQLARNIAGTAEGNYKDGIFETSRKSAVNMARTLCNAVSNNAKDTFYNANSDVIDGVEILSTLDGRTCPVCASLDRQRFPLGKPHPALPIHNMCRCVLLPVTPLSDLVEEERPMAKSDFMLDAKEFYKKRFPEKDWDALSDSTKKKYYYEAMRRFEQRTGESAYTQVSGGVSFRDYLEKYMTDEQRKQWLGPERFKLWKKGNLPLDKFIPPYPDKRLTVDALKELDKQSFDKEKTSVYRASKEETNIDFISKRAKSDEREFFAEAFAIYEKAGILNDDVKNFIKEVLK
jgi:SPP1 gp7 family putative phage head morphogenesis protein